MRVKSLTVEEMLSHMVTQAVQQETRQAFFNASLFTSRLLGSPRSPQILRQETPNDVCHPAWLVALEDMSLPSPISTYRYGVFMSFNC
jgi:hypothetical protein